MRRIWEWAVWFLESPHGNGARDVLSFLMLAYGVAYMVTGSGAREINVFPMRLYGLMLAGCGVWLLVTRNCRRLGWSGRAAALLAMALWLLIAFSAWGAWVSISGAFVLAAVAANEARTRVC